VNIYNPDGKLIGRINLPERCANLCFGGTTAPPVHGGSKSVYALYVIRRERPEAESMRTIPDDMQDARPYLAF